jgi:hypothetical protein
MRLGQLASGAVVFQAASALVRLAASGDAVVNFYDVGGRVLVKRSRFYKMNMMTTS